MLLHAVGIMRSEGINATKSTGDVRKEDHCRDAVKHTVKAFGKSLDILVNSAAGNFLAKAEDLSSNGFRTGKLSQSVSDESIVFVSDRDRHIWRLQHVLSLLSLPP